MLKMRRLRSIVTIYSVITIIIIHLVFTAINVDALTCNQIDVCTCKIQGGKDDGKTISLWEIDAKGKAGFKGSDGNSDFFYNPCTPFSKGSGAQCQNVLACQYYTPEKEYFYLGKAGEIQMTYTDPTKGVTFVYTGSKTGQQSPPNRIFTLTLKCDKEAEQAKLANFQESTGQYRYTADLTTKCACPGVCRALPGRNGGRSKHKPSTGTILCIVLLVLVVVYVVGGILINKYGRKKEGSEVLPNKDFWKDAPMLVKDGAVFTWRKIRRKEDQYEKI